jgi:dimethylaniline monooxygenase (N-oxide forming)
MIGDTGIVGRFLEMEKSMIYLAPEVLKSLTKRTTKADIYSYGIMLWEMWYGTQAFTELMPIDQKTFREKIAGGYRPIEEDMDISIPRIQDVRKSCWKALASERPPAKECYGEFQDILKCRDDVKILDDSSTLKETPV